MRSAGNFLSKYIINLYFLNGIKYLILLIFLFNILYSCQSPTAPSVNLNLALSDVTCTEAWLNIDAGNLSLPANITIKKNGNNFLNLTISKKDTTIYDSTLFPSQTYTYQVEYLKGFAFERSEAVTAKTLDTTSHDFTWQTFTFGNTSAGSSTLNDVAVISADNIIAVGEIYMNDSTGKPDLLPYNAVHWDGIKWELNRITTVFRGSLVTVPLEGIFTFSPTDIWAIGSLPIHGDGQNWTMYDVRTTTDPSLSLSDAWGSKSNDMYFIGRNGSIAHYENAQWNKIKSGTNNNFTDIWGITTSTGELIYCVSHDQYGANKSEIISIQNKEAAIVPFNVDEWIALSIWTPDKNIIYMGGGNGLFKCVNNSWKKIDYNNDGYVGGIRGNASNDFFITGGFGLAAHFNGRTWKVFNEISLSAGNYSSIAMKANLVVMVGDNYGRAVIALGRRN